jgi:RNA polymerase sigma-70 factor (ECF subfamily)
MSELTSETVDHLPSVTEPRPPRAEFPVTRWSIVAGAARADSAEALAWLCERYWFPLFAYVRSKGHPKEDAEDLVQGFFSKLLEDKLVERADGERGRFRSYLLGCMNRFMAGEWRHSNCLKRGGGVQWITLDGDEAEARIALEVTAKESPEAQYDRTWALTLLDRVTEQVREECEADGNEGRFEVLKTFINGARGDVPLAEAAERLGVSLAAMKSTVHRLRKRFRERLLAEIRETVTTPEEVAEELQHLFATLSAA